MSKNTEIRRHTEEWHVWLRKHLQNQMQINICIEFVRSCYFSKNLVTWLMTAMNHTYCFLQHDCLIQYSFKSLRTLFCTCIINSELKVKKTIKFFLEHVYMRPEVNSNRFQISNGFEKSFRLHGNFTAPNLEISNRFQKLFR